MKYLLIFATLVALICLNANSATTGSLILRGSVAKKVELTVTPETGALTLDLHTSQTDLKVASVNERSNVQAGYKVQIASTNLGNLVQSGVTNTIPYTAKYGGSNLNLLTGSTINGATGTVDTSKDLTISYTAVDEFDIPNGDYTDTINFTIIAN